MLFIGDTKVTEERIPLTRDTELIRSVRERQRPGVIPDVMVLTDQRVRTWCRLIHTDNYLLKEQEHFAVFSHYSCHDHTSLPCPYRNAF